MRIVNSDTLSGERGDRDEFLTSCNAFLEQPSFHSFSEAADAGVSLIEDKQYKSFGLEDNRGLWEAGSEIAKRYEARHEIARGIPVTNLLNAMRSLTFVAGSLSRQSGGTDTTAAETFIDGFELVVKLAEDDRMTNGKTDFEFEGVTYKLVDF